MKKRMLFVGQREIWNKVERVAEEFPLLSVTPLLKDRGIDQSLDQLSLSTFDVVLTPMFESGKVKRRFPEKTVCELTCSPMALNAALTKCLFSQSLNSEGKVSIDYRNKEEIRMQVMEENLPLDQLEIFEHTKEMNVNDILAHHMCGLENHQVTSIITTHPRVFQAFKAMREEVHLITPTHSCIRKEIQKLVDQWSSLGPSFPYRLEGQKSLQHMKNIGISGATIYRLIGLCRTLGRDRMTAAELAKGFSITLRSARRILTTLENHSLATIIGEEQIGGRGRPRYVYQVDLSSFEEGMTSLHALG
ncbi:hypothetical protein LC065_08015 [Halobacillus litoralis]|uniref:hypothetical protein n=1 Tax=Halobacillus litoralis TaxID=45668 RepID=UPI001CFC548E|nr:hypothetical protein [Halobacillus litoralis]WLR49095.1 hypothetical protein LC065_08015 [Halobacillus litoralis]